MKLEIENYFGSTIVLIDYLNINYHGREEELKKQVDDIAAEYGFNIADIETDFQIRVQQIEVTDEGIQDRIDLLAMINKFNENFL